MLVYCACCLSNRNFNAHGNPQFRPELKIKKILIHIAALLILTLKSTALFGQNGNSQFTDMLDGRFDVSNYLSDNAYGFLPVPIIITDPAVDGGLGLAGLFFHESEEEKDRRLEAMKSTDSGADQYLIPPSVSALAAAGTGNESWFAGAGHLGFFDGGRIRYTGGIGHGDINLDFFGSGSVTLERPVELNTQASGLFQKIQFRLGDHPLFLGISQRYIDAKISPNSLGALEDILPPDFIDELKRLLTSEVVTSGLGFNLEYDTRDNVFSPHQGYRYTLEHLWFRDRFGSDIEYELTNFQGLNYWVLTEQWRLGVKFDSEYADSDDLLPPFATPAINLRGIPAMRYQGNFVAAIETELTWQVDSRWSVNGFVGVGRASDSTSEFSEAPNRSTQGLGFRYMIARRYGFETGVDVARGPEETVFYITAGSAWGR